jgi:hypothetical protein
MLERFGVGKRLRSRFFAFRLRWDVSSASLLDWLIVSYFSNFAQVVFRLVLPESVSQLAGSNAEKARPCAQEL